MLVRSSLLLILLLVISCEPGNKAPDALFSCYPPEGNIRTLFDLDATATEDPDGLKTLLEFRWDYNGDGQWDTEFGHWRVYSCNYPVPGSYEVKLEVRDTHGGVSSSTFTVKVDSLHHFTDPRDARVYPVVKLGPLWWFGRNLDVGKLLDPSVDPAVNGVIEKYSFPSGDPDSLNGGLYTWAEMMGGSYSEGTQGICPQGWHIPTDNEWREMLRMFRSAAPRTGVTYTIWGEPWVPDQTVIHDNYQTDGAIWRLLRETGNTGFDAVMVGYRDPAGAFGTRDYHFPGQTATFWTSTMLGDRAVRVRLYQDQNHQGDLIRLSDNRRFAFSVRCVKESL